MAKQREQLGEVPTRESVTRELTSEEQSSIVRGGGESTEQKPRRPPKESITEHYAHEQLVQDVLELLSGVYQARMKYAPDQKYLARMRQMYDRQNNGNLEKTINSFEAELKALKE